MTISFVLVMGLFGIGNILLKGKRAKLPPPGKAKWLAVLGVILKMVIRINQQIH